jgi:hypothetical protein
LVLVALAQKILVEELVLVPAAEARPQKSLIFSLAVVAVVAHLFSSLN